MTPSDNPKTPTGLVGIKFKNRFRICSKWCATGFSRSLPPRLGIRYPSDWRGIPRAGFSCRKPRRFYGGKDVFRLLCREEKEQSSRK